MKKPAYKIGDEVWIKGKMFKRTANDVWGVVIKAFDNFDGSEWEQGLLIREKDLNPVTKESTHSDQTSTQDKTVSTQSENLDKVNRLEVIGNGREFVKWVKEPLGIRLDFQDDGRTLKIFLDNPQPTEEPEPEKECRCERTPNEIILVKDVNNPICPTCFKPLLPKPQPELPVRVAFDRDVDYFDPYGRDLQLEYVVNKILDYLKAKEAGE